MKKSSFLASIETMLQAINLVELSFVAGDEVEPVLKFKISSRTVSDRMKTNF